MEQPTFHLPPPCEQTSVITSRLQNLADEARSLIQTIGHGRLQFTSDEYMALEAAGLNLAEIATSVSGEVQALGKRREQTVFKEGQKLFVHRRFHQSRINDQSKAEKPSHFRQKSAAILHAPKRVNARLASS
jgi:hypothetical protein